jgi:hypothetical protein
MARLRLLSGMSGFAQRPARHGFTIYASVRSVAVEPLLVLIKGLSYFGCAQVIARGVVLFGTAGGE